MVVIKFLQLPMISVTAKCEYQHIFLSERYIDFMKLILTILLGLLLLQSVTSLHLHTEEEGAGNVTTTTSGANETTVDANATDSNESQEEAQISETQQQYAAIEASDDEDLKKEAKEAREAFEASAEEIKKKIEAVGDSINEDSTDEQRENALAELEKYSGEFQEAADKLSERVKELFEKLQAKNASAGSE